MNTKSYSMRSLVNSVSPGKLALSSLVAVTALGAAAPAEAISWDDAGNSASKLWTNFGNWSPDGSPASQPVFIGNFVNAANDTTILDQAFTIDSLTLTNGADVVTSTDGGATNDFQLTVTGLTSITGAGSTFFVIGADGDGLDTTGLTLGTGGTLNLNSTTVQGTAVTAIRGTASRLNNNVGGTIIGTGRIDFDANQAAVTNVFTNNGTITANTPTIFFGFAPAAGTLRINDVNDPEARFDWDGSGLTAVINVNGNQTLDVDMSTGSDAWSSVMNLSTGSTLDMRDAWAMDSGTINANTPAFGLIIIGQDPNPGPAASITGANWTMTGGTINVDDTWDSLELDSTLVASGGTINNEGHMIFNAGATIQSGVDFNMTGGGARLTVNGSAVNIDTPDFNLDGSGLPGNITTITNGGNLDLDLGAGADEDFNHDIFITNGGELDVTTADNNWSIQSNGSLTVNGGGTANVNGEALTFSGDLTVTDNSFLTITAATTMNTSTSVVIDSGSTVNMGTTTYNGGSYTGAGIFRPGTKTVDSITAFNVDILDLDDGSTTLNAQLTINADQIDSSGDGVDGTTTINNSGALIVNLTGNATWQVDGTVTYNGDAISGTIIGGSSAVEFQPGSTLNVNGEGAMIARAILEGTVNINSAGEDLELFGGNTVVGNTNIINGATINGPGVFAINSGQALRGDGTINAPVRGTGSAQLIAEGGLLDVNGSVTDIGTIGTSGAAAVLQMNAWDTNVADIVRLNGGRLEGGTITNNEASGIEGEGLVVARVVNNTILEADSGGTLEFTNTASDWDGTGNTGTLRAIGAGSVLEINDNFTFLFNGTVTAQNGGLVFANGFELEFDPASTLNLINGGTYRSNNATDLGGDINVSGAQGVMDVNATAVIENGSNTTLNANLLLANNATNIESGATFSGAGRLINANGSQLRLLNNANVAVLVENRGSMNLGTGNSIARGDVADFVQDSAAELNIDIGGTGLGQFDRLFVNGNAELSGELDLDIVGGFVPALLDSVTILNSAGLIGNFDTIDGVLYAPGRALAVTYDATSVMVTATLPGDTDLDGDVDDSDLGTSFAGYTGPVGAAGGKTWADGDTDGDGDVDDSDLGTSFSSYTGPLGPALVPEPTSLALLGLGGLLIARRRRS